MLQSSICSWGFVNFLHAGGLCWILPAWQRQKTLAEYFLIPLQIADWVFASGVFIFHLQVVEEVFSIQKHVFQCTHYHSVNLVIWINFLSVVLHKEDAVQWNAQLLVESFNLSQSNNIYVDQ